MRGVVAVLMGIWIARHLGAGTFGLYSWALSLAAFAICLGGMGLEAVVVRELVRRPGDAGRILGSASRLRLAGALIGAIGVALVGLALRHGEATAGLLAALAASAVVPAAWDSADAFFQSRHQQSIVASIRMGTTLLGNGIRAAILLQGGSVAALLLIGVAEAGAATLLLLAAYRRSASPAWQWDAGEAKTLLRSALPLLGGGLAVTIYMRLDQILLAQLADDRVLGTYATAIRLTEVWYLPAAVAAGVAYPHLLQARQRDDQAYRRQLAGLYALAAWSALALAVVITCSADPLVSLVYGPGYQDAAPALRILTWCTIPVFVGLIVERHLQAQDETSVILIRTLAAAAGCIALNIVLIPLCGMTGAAWAACISQGVSLLSLVCWRRHRRELASILTAVIAPWRAISGLRHEADRPDPAGTP